MLVGLDVVLQVCDEVGIGVVCNYDLFGNVQGTDLASSVSSGSQKADRLTRLGRPAPAPSSRTF